LQFATLGLTQIQSSLSEPIYRIDNFCNDPYSITITAAQIGSSSFDYSASVGVGAYIAIGTTYLGTTGAVNYGNCSMYTAYFYVSSATPETAYSVFAAIVNARGCTGLGNINFTQGRSIGTTSYQLDISQSVTALSLNVVPKTLSGSTSLGIASYSGVSGTTVSTYSFTVTYAGTVTSMSLFRAIGLTPTLVKLGGGTLGVTGVNVSNVNASPANTWYTTGTVTSSTGWNAGAAPAPGRGSFLLF
jgi:hypothetical protein